MSPNRLPQARHHELEWLAAAGRAQGRPTRELAAQLAAQAGITRLWAWRLATGWTRAELLGRLRQAGDPSVDESMLWRWETGERAPGRKHLDRLYRVYQTRPDRLGYGHDYTPAGAAPPPHGRELAPPRPPPPRPQPEEVNPRMRGTHLTAAQAAARLHVSPKTISRWAKQGRLEHTRTLGGHRRFDPDDIDRLAEQLTEPADPPHPQ
jgi:excisionase family DNA binding protein